jgi:hypothetical protein
MSVASSLPDGNIEASEDLVDSRLADDAIIGLKQILAGDFVSDAVLNEALGMVPRSA